VAGNIFISYRRTDEPGFALALYTRLEQEFPSEKLFMDVEGHIKAGDDFTAVLNEQVAQCDVLLAIIGERWLNARDGDGNRRLENDGDFVRIEIASALGLGKRVIPVLVNEAQMPRADDLPASLKSLALRNAVAIRLTRFKADSQGLINALREALAEAERAKLQGEREAVEAERRRREAKRRRREAKKEARAAEVEPAAREWAIGLSVLMLSFVFLGLWMMNYERAKALSDPTACNVVAQARDLASPELNPQMLARINQVAPWSSRPAARAAWPDPLTAPLPDVNANPCGEAPELVFGRNTTDLTLGTLDPVSHRCRAVDVELKTLVANFREPAIMATDVELLSRDPAGGPPVTHKLGDVVPQAMRELQMQQASLTGDEIFVTDAVLDLLAEKVNAGSRTASGGSRTLTPTELAAVHLCIAGKAQVQPPRIGGIVSGLPQRRGLPYMALVANSSNVTTQTDTFQQAVFYTDLDRAGDLDAYLQQQNFSFAIDDIRRMTVAGRRFHAVGLLVWLVGGIMVAAAFSLLLTSVRAFIRKNARPAAALRAYGSTKSGLRLEIFRRLGAVSAFPLIVLAVAGAILGASLYFLFQSAGLPLPALSDVARIFAGALAVTVASIAVVVYLSVEL
jgi:hypothetical protein